MRILALLFPMKRTKVKIRSYPISQGRRSLQLDYYPPIRNPETNKLVRMETLGMYIFDKPQTAFQREHNTATLAQAEAIRGMRQQSVINEEFGFLDKTKLKADFLAFSGNSHRKTATHGKALSGISNGLCPDDALSGN